MLSSVLPKRLISTSKKSWARYMNASYRLFELLAPLVGGRVYPLYVPEAQNPKAPYIIYNIISSLPDNTLDGVTGHDWVNVQIDVYGKTYDATASLANQVVTALNSIKPSIYDGTIYTTEDHFYRAIIEYQFWQTTNHEE